MMKQLWLMMLLSLIAVACNSGAGKDNDKNDDYTSADTIAVLRMVETMYSGDERPDSAILRRFVRLTEFQKRGVPEHLSLIGPNSVIPEDRIGLLNIATADEIGSGRRHFLESTWAIDSTEYIRNDATNLTPDGNPCHITVRYELLSDTLLPVDTLYYHDGMEF
ncbi:hypothetical protein [uncultured Duncaniella sp.]|uniref:hypothetical protein n=1 Tax=uncultured Duncaniella sp. TaxID=2768039 RepID=UPI0025B69836|nr:hypothetical protein [uncultured Duncaniella sp.]